MAFEKNSLRLGLKHNSRFLTKKDAAEGLSQWRAMFYKAPTGSFWDIDSLTTVGGGAEGRAVLLSLTDPGRI